MKKIKEQKGYTLIELLLALGLISVIAILGFIAYANVSQSMQDKETSDKLTDIKLAYMEAIYNNPNVKKTSYNGLGDVFGGKSFFEGISPYLNDKNQQTVKLGDGFSFNLNKNYNVVYSDVNFSSSMEEFSPGLMFMSLSQGEDQKEKISTCIRTAKILSSTYDSVQVSGYDYIKGNGSFDLSKVTKGCSENPDFLNAGFIVAPRSSAF